MLNQDQKNVGKKWSKLTFDPPMTSGILRTTYCITFYWDLVHLHSSAVFLIHILLFVLWDSAETASDQTHWAVLKGKVFCSRAKWQFEPPGKSGIRNQVLLHSSLFSGPPPPPPEPRKLQNYRCLHGLWGRQAFFFLFPRCVQVLWARMEIKLIKHTS